MERIRVDTLRTRPVWLPPLPSRLTLARIIPDDTQAVGADILHIPIGLLDDPTKQRQDPWLFALSSGGGHASITGAPQSGGSTFLRTVAASVALTHTPQQVTMYGMDLTGNGLARISAFPHVGGVATRAHPERLVRLLEELHGMLATREAVFRDNAIDSLQDLRRRHAEGRIPELVSAYIVLLVDGLGAVRTDFEELEEPLADLLQRGGGFGIHVVLALSRWNELRMNLQNLIGTPLELKLGDPGDSQISRKLSAVLKADQPGRVLTDGQLLAQLALPVLDEVDDDSVGDGLEALADRSASSLAGAVSGAHQAPSRIVPS